MITNAETDPSGLNPSQQGAKLDAGKTPVYQGAIAYFPRALEAIAAVSAKGAEKYSWMGWASVENGAVRYENAMARHITKEAKGEVYDVSGPGATGLLHKAQRAWNDLASLELFLRDLEKDGK